ncbi:hypothetical protein RRG08_036551 [Elysia crispata]|uniref:Secreted protein n=1 Tax=Elysia crispata TaxID=231223 RepID=A0AAE0XZ41_9GAST|nr:hypothetical protein RRG08_036551 [Elysia crispata]
MKTVSLTSLSNTLNVLCLCAFSLKETITASHDHEDCIPYNYKLIQHAGRHVVLCILRDGNYQPTASHDHEDCITYKLIQHVECLVSLCILLDGNN